VIIFLDVAGFLIGIALGSGVDGEESIIEGVRGDEVEVEEPEDEGLEGSKAGTGTSRRLRLTECDRGEELCIKRGEGGGRYMIASCKP
jgi:hypothetical protein